jgi:hypothetical protein
MSLEHWIWFALGAAVALLAGVPVYLTMARRASSLPTDGAAEALDTVTGWPPEATRVMGTHERLAYQAVSRAMPEHLLLAEVSLARFLNVPRRHSYSEWLKRAGHLSVDLLVCDSASQVLAVVLLRSPQDSARRLRRVQRMQRVLHAAKVRVVVWTAGDIPGPEAVREAIVPTPKTQPFPGTAPLPQPALPRAFDNAVSAPAYVATGLPLPVPLVREAPSLHDLRPLRETPASTWFDDLESGPMPLPRTRPEDDEAHGRRPAPDGAA